MLFLEFLPKPQPNFSRQISLVVVMRRNKSLTNLLYDFGVCSSHDEATLFMHSAAVAECLNHVSWQQSYSLLCWQLWLWIFITELPEALSFSGNGTGSNWGTQGILSCRWWIQDHTTSENGGSGQTYPLWSACKLLWWSNATRQAHVSSASVFSPVFQVCSWRTLSQPWTMHSQRTYWPSNPVQNGLGTMHG